MIVRTTSSFSPNIGFVISTREPAEHLMIPHASRVFYPAGRLLRDAKLYEIGAGTSEIRRMLIGRELFEKTR